MKKLLTVTAGLAAAYAMSVMLPVGSGQTPPVAGKGAEPFSVPIGQTAPAGGQAYLPTSPGLQKLPASPQAGTTYQGSASELFSSPRASVPGFASPDPEKPSALREFLSQNFDAPDPNQDIAVRPELGNWTICVNWYSGVNAAKMAREMVSELRSNQQYKLNAFVFRKGVEECKAHQEFLLKYIEDQRKYLAMNQLPAATPMRVPLERHEIQYAVLVGGYKDMESARRALDQLKKLPAPDPKRVQLNQEYLVKYDDKGAPLQGAYVPINPFMQAMVVLNPSTRSTTQQAKGMTAEELTALKWMNADEPFSLLKCPKNFSLAVKQFAVPASVKPAKESSSWYDKFGFGGSTSKVDGAAVNAHNLAEVLRKNKFEAYVLHTNYCSYVFVGEYESPNDPRIARFREQLLPQLNAQLPPSIKLAADPKVWQVPK